MYLYHDVSRKMYVHTQKEQTINLDSLDKNEPHHLIPTFG